MIEVDREIFSLESLKIKTGVNGTFVGSPLEFAQFCNDQFNSETSFNGVLRRLVSLISDWFGVEQITYLTMDTAYQSPEARDPTFRFHPMPGLSDEALSVARRALQPALAGDDEVRLGLFVLQASGFDFNCAQFDEPGPLRGVLIWAATPNQNVGPGALIAPHGGINKGDILEFLVRAAQQSARWLRRLDKAQSLLYQDEVTGLYNYRYLDVAIEAELKRFQRFQAPFSLLFIDIDNFKQVNDGFGHLTGSSVLRQVGIEIKAAVRDIDSVLRYGGDEFVVILIGANSRQAAAAAERVRSRVERGHFRVEGSLKTIHVTASIGVACCPDHGLDKSTIIQVADETMYRAKNGGKNRVIMPQQSDRASHKPTTFNHGRQR
jgi:diguanylate cyclase (GGDEF)-like protein